MIGEHRRVVTGLDAAGKSCVLIDGPIPANSPQTGFAWRTAALPADNSGSEDIPRQAYSFELLHDGGANFMVAEYPPNAEPYWHATDTIDYIVVLEGEMVFDLEAGPAHLQAGDFVVDRGVTHSWRNPGPGRTVMAIVTLPAHPVGKGKTV